eukprot:278381-Chlamydomonas_euryale.AAC.13
MSVVNVLSYVETLPPDIRDKLFESPWTCQAVLRSLQPLAKQYILRLMWIERPVLQGTWTLAAVRLTNACMHACMHAHYARPF